MRIVGSIKNYPARVLAVGYLALIVLGSLALMHPRCRLATAVPLSWLDAVFTSTSAVCVTGLVVRSTGNELSFWGQAVVLLLIQVGGIGIMTFTTFAMFSIGRPANLRHRAILSTTIGADDVVDLRRLLRDTLLVTVVFESVGFAVLATRNLVAGLPILEAAWHALFHSVSAFCNAGFALSDDSLVSRRDDVVVNLTIMGLVVGGGIGFPVILDLIQNWRVNRGPSWERLTLHTKLMLIGTATLVLLGAVAFLVLEWNNTLSDVPLRNRPLVALFHSVTCRTAGFNSVEITGLTNAMLFVSIVLMMIGAGPGSTAGGFKVSTLAILVLRAWASARGCEKVNAFRRTIPRDTIVKAMVTAMLFMAVGAAALTGLLAFEQSRQPHLESKGLFLEAAFEVVSALGTVGLSAGLTTQLNAGGRAIIVALMFIGRLGPITVFTALSRSDRTEPVEFSSEEPLIG